jgi:hypothetical protein
MRANSSNRKWRDFSVRVDVRVPIDNAFDPLCEGCGLVGRALHPPDSPTVSRLCQATGQGALPFS